MVIEVLHAPEALAFVSAICRVLVTASKKRRTVSLAPKPVPLTFTAAPTRPEVAPRVIPSAVEPPGVGVGCVVAPSTQNTHLALRLLVPALFRARTCQEYWRLPTDGVVQ